MILEIVLPIPIKKTFLYELTERPKKKPPKIGNLVLVDFKGKKLIGIIWEIKQNSSLKKKLKKIDHLFEEICLKDEIIKIINFISEYTCNPISLIFKLFISGFPKKNFKKILESQVRIKNAKFQCHPKTYIKLNKEQKITIKKINNYPESKFNVVVLDGTTSSGKTRVYMHAIIEKLKKGFQCLILVPEKILTTQWVDELIKDFGFEPHIFHSSVNPTKRQNIWIGCFLGKISVVIGTRSALFLPFKNLGLIVVDEEHDISYKQEEGVIVNIRDISVLRAYQTNCLIVLSSATPSIETIYNCKKKKYNLLTLRKRVGDSKLPKIQIIDIKKSSLKNNKWISENLKIEIEKTLQEKKQSLIFLNKRGYASINICKICGFSKTCKDCDFSLVLHKSIKHSELSKLICHCCNYWEYFKNECENCHKKNSLISLGVGVQRIYEEIKILFPNANICLLSSDMVSSNKDYIEILNKIHNQEIDIIIGTQITSKGHHFPNLKTVGILNIDNMLNSFDLRAVERTFQLITQVSGRAGRNSKDGKVLIQTFQPKHKIFDFIKNYKKEEYFKWDLENRMRNSHPPYSNLISIIVEGTNKIKSKKISEKIVNDVGLKFKDIYVYGPASAIIFKLKNKFRYRILIKFHKNYQHIKNLKYFLNSFRDNRTANIRIDVDPQSFL